MWVRESLRCPVCRGEVRDGEGCLICAACHLAYPVRDGIPVLLAEDAQVIS